MNDANDIRGHRRWRKLRQRMLAETPMCEQCGWRPSCEIHHRTRVADGGGNEASNLVALCSQCHAEAHDGVSAERRAWRRYVAELVAKTPSR